jgi:putative serine protease PepD
VNEEHHPDEPTQPLTGWRPAEQAPLESQAQSQAQAPSHLQPQHTAPAAPTNPFWLPPHDAPHQPAAGPVPHATTPYPTATASSPGRRRKKSLSLGAWFGVAAVALLLGLVGGLGGAAIHGALDESDTGGGLETVRTKQSAPLPADNGSVSAVAEVLLPSTVQILAGVGNTSGGATGSGFVFDEEGHVVTNNHVVATAARDDDEILVIDHSGERHEASVVGRSTVYDLAVLKIDNAASLEPAALGQSQVLRVGDVVIAFGAPLGLSQTVTSGIVSALDRPVTTSGDEADDMSYINAVQTDAAINPGNSGGPLVNLAGEVVGVNSAIATTGGGLGESGNIGVGFAIPIEQVRTTVDQILRTGEAQYPIIGAKVRTGGEAATAAGAEILGVAKDSPAERAGIEEKDVVVAVDGKAVTDGIALIVAIRTHKPGDTIELLIERDGREQTVEVELDGEVG